MGSPEMRSSWWLEISCQSSFLVQLCRDRDCRVSLLSDFTSLKSSFSAPRKLVPLSEFMEAGVPYRARNLRKVIRKSPVDREVATSIHGIEACEEGSVSFSGAVSTVTHLYWPEVIYGCPVEGWGEDCKSFSR